MLSYHSLEDRQVKQCFQRLAQEGTLKILTKKVIQASDAEIAANPRARSVKMRVAEKIDPDQSRDAARGRVAAMTEFFTVKQIDNSRLVRPWRPTACANARAWSRWED